MSGAPLAHGSRLIDLTLHGFLDIRLVDPDPHHAAYLRSHFGASPSPVERPDLIIRFEEDIGHGPLTRLGQVSAGFSDEGFFLADRESGRAEVRLPFGTNRTWEVVYRRSLTKLPLLLDVVRLLVVEKGYVAVHAVACQLGGTGMLVMGWPQGGKTGALLAMAAAGAAYVGEEWVFVSGDGERMYGTPGPIWVSPRHTWALRRAGVNPGVRRRLFRALVRTLDDPRIGPTLRSARTIEEALPYLRRRARTPVAPGAVFDRVLDGVGIRPDVLFVIQDRDLPDTRVAPADPVDLARRMAAVDRFEDSDLLRLYDGFRFGFPGATDPKIESVHERRLLLLEAAFTGKPAFRVEHPYAGSVDELQSALTSRF